MAAGIVHILRWYRIWEFSDTKSPTITTYNTAQEIRIREVNVIRGAERGGEGEKMYGRQRANENEHKSCQ